MHFLPRQAAKTGNRARNEKENAKKGATAIALRLKHTFPVPFLTFYGKYLPMDEFIATST